MKENKVAPACSQTAKQMSPQNVQRLKRRMRSGLSNRAGRMRRDLIYKTWGIRRSQPQGQEDEKGSQLQLREI